MSKSVFLVKIGVFYPLFGVTVSNRGPNSRNGDILEPLKPLKTVKNSHFPCFLDQTVGQTAGFLTVLPVCDTFCRE